MEDLVKNQGVIARAAARRRGEGAARGDRPGAAEAVAKDPVTKKVHDSYMAYKAKYDAWADLSETVYHAKIRRA